MKLRVTIGTTNGSLVGDFDVAENEFAEYIGLELVEDEGPLTILRIPFRNHGKRIHTMCIWGEENETVVTET